MSPSTPQVSVNHKMHSFRLNIVFDGVWITEAKNDAFGKASESSQRRIDSRLDRLICA